MADHAHPTRATLLDAGLAASEDTVLSALSVDQVVRHAGVAKGTFYVHFDDRGDYLTALHRRFHDELRAKIAAKVAGLEPGENRLRRGTVAYLDGCLHARGVKAMLAQARGVPEIGQAVATSNERFATAVRADLDALGWAHPLEAARLFVAMAAETALGELAAGKRLPRLRAALFSYAGNGGASLRP